MRKSVHHPSHRAVLLRAIVLDAAMYSTKAAHIDPGTLRSLQAAIPDAMAPTTTLRSIDAVVAFNGFDPNVNQFAANFILMRRVIYNVPDAEHSIQIILSIVFPEVVFMYWDNLQLLKPTPPPVHSERS